jgi:hypothetical protein
VHIGVRHPRRRLGGWRLAPQLLVEQLAQLELPAPLVVVPRQLGVEVADTSKDTIDVVTGMARYSGVPVTLHPAPAS